MAWFIGLAAISFAGAVVCFELAVRPERTNRQDIIVAAFYAWLLGLAGGACGMYLWLRLGVAVSLEWR